MLKRVPILAAVFFLLYNFTIPIFASAEDADLEALWQYNDEAADRAENYIQKIVQTSPHKKKYKSKQRPILIEGAMNIEIEKLVRALKKPTVYNFSNYLFVAGTYKDYPVVVLRTEQGLANAAASTVIGIKEFNPIAVINQGTAGAHVTNLHNDNIVIGETSVNIAAYRTEYTPEGAGIDMTKQDMRGTFAYDETSKEFKLNTAYESDTKLLSIAESVADSHSEFTTLKGTISSADSWIELVDYMKFLNEKYGSLCEEMETNAAASICKSAGVPFIGIRAISNNITNDETFSVDTAATCQNFVLLVAEKYIQGIKG